jgi:hypothetical protein
MRSARIPFLRICIPSAPGCYTTYISCPQVYTYTHILNHVGRTFNTICRHVYDLPTAFQIPSLRIVVKPKMKCRFRGVAILT